MSLTLYNTLSRSKEEFKPLGEPVGLYTCGPTVYHYAHIGNLRTYIFTDLLKRSLRFNGYRVEHVMNVTDVGHLVGDGDMGEDKMAAGAAREGKSAWEIADFYLAAFKKDLGELNISEPDIWCKATEYISQQIDLIKTLEAKGFTYLTGDGVYFDTAKFPDYNKLSHLNLEDLKEGARIERNDEKRSPTDFALWKFSKAGEQRQMEWASPWGVGFPGWHIECSAMSLHFLAGRLDIHCGGVDHINIHHTNEIAQSEAATGQKFFNYWLHGGFLNVGENEKMSKSSGNLLTLDLVTAEEKVEPLAFRYACLLTHYRKPMSYKPGMLVQAAAGLQNIRKAVAGLQGAGQTDAAAEAAFREAVNDDLNMPQALAVFQNVLKSALPEGDKAATLKKFDEVLGLGLVFGTEQADAPLPADIADLVDQRKAARQAKDWAASDALRGRIEAAGYIVEDQAEGMKVRAA